MNPIACSLRFAVVLGVPLLFAACSSPSVRQTSLETAEVVPAALRPGDQVVLPTLVSAAPKPAYPSTLLKRGQAETVEVDCVIDENGRVCAAHVHGTPQREFSRAALAAVEKWTFRPGTRNGQPVAMNVIVPVEFVLTD